MKRVCHEDSSSSSEGTQDRLFEEVLSDMSIDGRKGIIQQDDISVVVQTASNIDTLLLPTA